MSIEFVIKRNGSREKFNPEKIEEAVWKAVESVGGTDREKCKIVTEKIVQKILSKFNDTVSVEQVQDVVEEMLIKMGFDRVAKAYILYRHQHNTLRNVKDIMQDVEMIDKYLNNEDWLIKENANTGYSLQGLNFNISQKVSANYWLTKVYPPELAKYHHEGDIHIHDLGGLAAYCVGWDLKQLLLQGFNGVEGKVSSGPPKHFRSALGQVVNFIFTLQNEAQGAQAFSNFDTYLAPFIRYDKLDRDSVKQALQEFLFNMNVTTRQGGQSPFSNITLDLKVPSHFKNNSIIIGGKLMPDKYGDFQPEMDLFNDVLFEVFERGDFSGRPFTFPIPTINIDKNFDFDNPSHDRIWRITSKYGTPYFSNYINSDINPEDTTSMCCRLRIDRSKLERRGGGLFGSDALTGSVGVVTINMPRIGYLSKDEKDFFDRLDNLIDVSKQSLELKRKYIEKWTEQGLYPFAKVYLKHTKDTLGSYWANHFSTIGLLGMNEACMNFLKVPITDPKGKEFAVKVMEYMREKILNYKKETGHEFNLEATPGEGTTRRFAAIDKKKFNDIIVANEKHVQELKAVPYYSNSTQIPVDSPMNLFEALDHQNALQPLYTGGTVMHIYLGESAPNPESVKALIKKCCYNYKIPYFSITPTFSICPIHGYMTGKHLYCPICLEPGDVVPENLK